MITAMSHLQMYALDLSSIRLNKSIGLKYVRESGLICNYYYLTLVGTSVLI